MADETISTDLLVSILHHGDSSFPSGGFAFSSGLEEFFVDQMIKDVADLESFIADLLVNRWIGFDAVALRRSYAAASDSGRRSASHSSVPKRRKVSRSEAPAFETGPTPLRFRPNKAASPASSTASSSRPGRIATR